MKKSFTMGIVFASLLVSATAFGAAQDKAQQKCINAMNKGMQKTAQAQLKANAKCISDFAKGKNMSASSCYQSPAKVTASETKTCDAETKKCTTPPTIGPTGCSDPNSHSDFEAHEMADNLLGNIPDSGVAICSSDKPGCKCQGKVLKATNKLYATYQKSFNKCKKTGLKDKVAPFDDEADLATCLGDDPKSKISKAKTKLLDAINKKCADTPVPFAGAGNDCVGLTGALLQNCIDVRVRCHVCINAQTADNIVTLNCDGFDDGNIEGSCFDDF